MPVLIVDPLEWPSHFSVPNNSPRAGDWIARTMNLPDDSYCIWRNQYEPFAMDGAIESVIIAGSNSSAYDSDPWILELTTLIQQWVEQDIPMLGICFGHQLIAEALGGRVEKNPAGWELGRCTVSLMNAGKEDWFFDGCLSSFPVMQSHRDAVIELPPDAVCLASSERCGIQAFGIGEKIRTVQFHPEFSVEVMQAILKCYTNVFEADGIDTRLLQETLAACPESQIPFMQFCSRCIREEAV